MHRHDLDALLARRIRLRLDIPEQRVQLRRVVEIAMPLGARKQREELLSRELRRLVVEAIGAVELAPRPLHPTGERCAVAVIERARQHARYVCQPVAAVVAQAIETIGSSQQLANRFVGVAAQRFEIRPAQAAPGRAQHRQPRDAIGRMQQRAREPRKILRGLLFLERVDFHGVHRPAVRAQPFAQPVEVSATLHEHRDRLFGIERPLLRENLDDACSFRMRPRYGDGRESNELACGDVADGRAGTESGDAGRNLVFRRKHAHECRVDPVHDVGRAAKVVREREARECDVADTTLLRAQEQRHVGVAKTVDRLHRIADEEQRATVVALPAGRQQLEQTQLRMRRVLEFVDENVLDAAIERQQQFRRSIHMTQRAARRERELHEIHFAPLREHNLELGGQAQQHVAQRNETLPLQVAVATFGQREHGRERAPERIVGAQAVDQCATAIA